MSGCVQSGRVQSCTNYRELSYQLCTLKYLIVFLALSELHEVTVSMSRSAICSDSDASDIEVKLKKLHPFTDIYTAIE